MPPAPHVNSTKNTRRSNPQSPSSYKMETDDAASPKIKKNLSSSAAAVLDDEDDVIEDDTDITRESSLPSSSPPKPLSLVDSASSCYSELDKFSLDGEEVINDGLYDNDKQGGHGGMDENYDDTERVQTDRGKNEEINAASENTNDGRAEKPGRVSVDAVENTCDSGGADNAHHDCKDKDGKSNSGQNGNNDSIKKRNEINRENVPWWQFNKRGSLQENAFPQNNNWKGDRKRSKSAHNFRAQTSVTLRGVDEVHSQQEHPGLFSFRINKSHCSERWGGANNQRESREMREFDGSTRSQQSNNSTRNFNNHNHNKNYRRSSSSSRSSWTSHQNSNFNDSQSSLLPWDDGLPPDPKSKQDVDTIVETMKSHSIVVNPLERALLEDMANTDEARLKTRWKGERMLMVSSLRGDGGLALCESIRDLDEGGSKSNDLRRRNIMEEREEDVNEENEGVACDHHGEDIGEEDDESLDLNNEYAAKYTNPNGDDKTQDLNGVESSSSVGTEELEDGSDVPCSRWKQRDQKKEQEAALMRRQSSIESLPDLKSKAEGVENEDVVCDWGSSDLCKMKENKGRVSKVDVVDDVSSIGSSVHSGRIAGGKKGRQPRERGVSVRRSFLSSFRWNSTLNQSAKESFGDDDIQKDDEDDTKLEEEIFARQDAKYEKIIQDANELMSKVNKSVVAMGNEAPFRPVEEVIPSLKKLHKNLLLQMDGLGTNLRQVKLTGRKKHPLRNANRHMRDSAVEGSIISMNSNTSGGSYAPSPNDAKAVDDFIDKQMGRSNLPLQPSPGMRSSLITISPSVSITQTSSHKSQATSAKHYTAYLPNHMWYQFSAGDPSSQIRPTSLCSGTGITGGQQYLDRQMLDVFDMFGSYFVGAFGTFKDDEDGNENPKTSNRRAAFWMESINEEDSMTNESMSGYESEMTLDLSVLDDDDIGEFHVEIDQPVDTETKIELLEKAIADLRRSQIK